MQRSNGLIMVVLLNSDTDMYLHRSGHGPSGPEQALESSRTAVLYLANACIDGFKQRENRRVHVRLGMPILVVLLANSKDKKEESLFLCAFFQAFPCTDVSIGLKELCRAEAKS